MTTKVKQTEIYKDSQGEHIVVKGKLVLIDAPAGGHNNMIATGIPTNRLPSAQIPIIISETEEIEIEDNALYINKKKQQSSYWQYYKIIQVFKIDKYSNNDISIKTIDNSPAGSKCSCQHYELVKILALPEHFSSKHLQAIIDGKLKDGDELFVECELIENKSNRTQDYYQIALFIPNTHIKLFPIKKEETWDEAMRILSNPDVTWGTKEAMIREKFNPPTKRK